MPRPLHENGISRSWPQSSSEPERSRGPGCRTRGSPGSRARPTQAYAMAHGVGSGLPSQKGLEVVLDDLV